MSDLKQALDIQKSSSVKELEKHDVIQEVKLLVQSQDTEDLRIMRGLGEHHQLIHAQNVYGKQLELEALDGKFAGDVYTYAQVEALAKRFNLKFLSSRLYTGTMDIEVIAKIKAFSKETNTNISDATIDRKFFIMAPKEHFKLKTEFVPSKRQLDPAIFYKIDDGHYKFIHKWGTDFNILRELNGFKWLNVQQYMVFRFFTILPIMAFLVAMIASKTFFITSPVWAWSITLVATIVFIVAVFVRLHTSSDGNIKKGVFSEDGWNSDKQYVYGK